MSEELKLVNCGCGGEAKVDIKLIPSAPIERKRIYCSKCYISTDWMKSEDEAIEVWNRAMGEQTAKVKNIQVEWSDDEYVNDRMGAMYYYGNCGNCDKTVSHNQKYCHECGSRLEWE